MKEMCLRLRRSLASAKSKFETQSSAFEQDVHFACSLTVDSTDKFNFLDIRELVTWVSKAKALSSYIEKWKQWASSSTGSQDLFSKDTLPADDHPDSYTSDDNDDDCLGQTADVNSVVENGSAE